MTKDDKIIVAYCGLVCSKCTTFMSKKCKGCFTDNKTTSKCKIKECAIRRHYRTCSECQQFSEISKCQKLNGLKDRLFRAKSTKNRITNLYKIKMIGLKEFLKMYLQAKN